MADRDRLATQLTHRIASELSRALADSGMTIRELSQKIGQSEKFVRLVLEGEDGIADTVKVRLLSDIAWATGCWISVSISPEADAEPADTVKSDGAA